MISLLFLMAITLCCQGSWKRLILHFSRDLNLFRDTVQLKTAIHLLQYLTASAKRSIITFFAGGNVPLAFPPRLSDLLWLSNFLPSVIFIINREYLTILPATGK